MYNRITHRLTVRSLFVLAAVVTALYWSVAAVTPSEPLNDLMDGALVAVALVTAYKYFSWTLFNFDEVAEVRHMIRFGIVLVWASTAAWRIQRFLYQEKLWSDAAVGVHDYWRGYFITMAAFGAALHVLSVGMEGGRPVERHLKTVVAAIVLGMVAVLITQLVMGDFGVQH